MDFTLSPEETSFQRACRDFLERACPAELPRAVAGGDVASQAGARKAIAEGGWSGLAAGQPGDDPQSFVNLGLFALEAGRVLLPTFFRCTVMAALAVALAGNEAQGRRYRGLAGGSLVAAVVPELPRGRFRLERGPRGLVATGRQPLVAQAASADLLLLFGEDAGGLIGLLVPPGFQGVSLRRVPALWGEPVYEVHLDAVRVEPDAVLGLDVDAGRRAEAWERWLDRSLALLAMEMAGGAARVVEITAEYVKKRYQFGHPLGSFQAVQHHLADMLILSDAAYAAALQSLWTAANRPRATRETSTAKLWASRAYRSNTVMAHQLHGGAGYVREAGLFLFSERAAADSVSLGTRDDHLRRLWAAARD